MAPVTLVTFLMMELCRTGAPTRRLQSFAYNSEKPVFDLGPFTVFASPDGDGARLWARDYEDALAVTATAGFEG